MTGMARHRLRLWADPSRLTGFNGAAVLDSARIHIRQLRGDVELTVIAQESPDSIGVVLLTAPTVSSDDIAEITADLRAFLDIGPGPDALIPDEAEGVRGIGGQGRTCPECRASDGSHLPGCPHQGGRIISPEGSTCPECRASGGSHLPGCPRSRR